MRLAARVAGGALTGSTALLLAYFLVDEIHWRRIEHRMAHRRR